MAAMMTARPPITPPAIAPVFFPGNVDMDVVEWVGAGNKVIVAIGGMDTREPESMIVVSGRTDTMGVTVLGTDTTYRVAMLV